MQLLSVDDRISIDLLGGFHSLSTGVTGRSGQLFPLWVKGLEAKPMQE